MSKGKPSKSQRKAIVAARRVIRRDGIVTVETHKYLGAVKAVAAQKRV